MLEHRIQKREKQKEAELLPAATLDELEQVVLSLIVVLLSFGDVEGEHHAAGDRGDALELRCV